MRFLETVIVVLGIALFLHPARAQEEKIDSGAVELGIAGALMSVEGHTQRSLLLRVGSFRGLPATGKSFECRCLSIFVFEEDRLVCERAYFDSATILRQLGIAHDPLKLHGRIATVLNHPVTIGTALARNHIKRG